MSIGARIAATLDLDAGPFDRQLTAEEGKALSFSGRMKKIAVSLGPQKGSDSVREMAAVAAAEERLAAFRRQSDFSRLSNGEKLTLMEREIAEASARVAAINGTTAEKLQLQLAIEQQMLEVERLRAALAAQADASFDRSMAAAEASAIGGGGGRSFARRGSSGSYESDGGLFGSGQGSLGSELKRAFGMGTLFRGLLAGLGIGTLQAMAEKMVGYFKDAAEDATEIADQTERARIATEKLIDSRRTDPQRLAFLQRDAASLTKKQREFAIGSSLGNLTTDEQKQSAKVNADLAENALAQAEIQKRIDEDKKQKLAELASAQKDLEAARTAAAESEMSDEEKLEAIRLRIIHVGLQAIDKRKTELEQVKLLTEKEQLLVEQKQLEKNIEEKKAQALAKQAELAQRVADATMRIEKADRDVASARRSIAEFDRSQLSFSLSDAATGKRGGGDLSIAAGRITRQEDRSQTLFDFAANARLRAQQAGAAGNVGEQERQLRDALDYESRSAALRQTAREQRANLPGLNAADRDPLAKLKEDLKNALENARTLIDIRDSLKAEAIK